MSDDLIKRLREIRWRADLMHEAADRIEQLAREVERRIEPEQVENLIKMADPIMTELYAVECSYRQEAETKLAKAVEALHIINVIDPEEQVSGYSPDALRGLVNLMGSNARTVLGELEGGGEPDKKQVG